MTSAVLGLIKCRPNDFSCADAAHIALLGYLYTWSGFEEAKTAPWPSQGLHRFAKFLEPSYELADRGCCCFLLRWHGCAFWAHQETALEICLAQI